MPQLELNSLVLGIDTCGPAGSVALGRLAAGRVEIVGETALEGRTYSALLAGAIAQLVEQAGAQMREVRGIVVVNGPGSFTGVRVGVSTAKGLADGLEIPVVALSRLEVLAHKAGVQAAALDAHRDEVYLRVMQQGQVAEESLAGADELGAVEAATGSVAICDDGAVRLLSAVWSDVELRRVVAPLASDALQLGAFRLGSGEAVDLILLDGHYLRRSDAEIFGEKTQAGA
ncbi:MAG: tRNA (adenosine(37)-N6)-threonylcarbamoyltransferase complex dimerization subunit type 1 TsaB [Terracidiphilus sp.]|nr:tRNA (adenosine(37)-N6)-threonylcarbamoyltransferase complex dimerization subunit type 1 TsaB [Terracidiphilus sp.]